MQLLVSPLSIVGGISKRPLFYTTGISDYRIEVRKISNPPRVTSTWTFIKAQVRSISTIASSRLPVKQCSASSAIDTWNPKAVFSTVVTNPLHISRANNCELNVIRTKRATNRYENNPYRWRQPLPAAQCPTTPKAIIDQ